MSHIFEHEPWARKPVGFYGALIRIFFYPFTRFDAKRELDKSAWGPA